MYRIFYDTTDGYWDLYDEDQDIHYAYHPPKLDLVYHKGSVFKYKASNLIVAMYYKGN